MSISDKFSTLIDNLKITNGDTISSRYKAITKRLNTDFWNSSSEISHSRYVGSVGRGTAIRGVSDVDMVMELPSDVYWQHDAYKSNGQSALLQAVKESIKKTYPNTHNVGDGQVVVVSFTDGIKFEVIPVFLNREGTYTYPDANNGGGWKVTDPVAEINAINDANNTYNQKVKHLAKMARAWKEKCNVPVPGILIDTLVFNFMKKWEYNDKSFLYYDFMTRDFLKYLSEQNPSQGYWLAPGSNRRVYGKGKFESKAKSSYNDALRAIEYENAKKEYSANQEWRKIFGNYFPS